jgi:hypothetical protein
MGVSAHATRADEMACDPNGDHWVQLFEDSADIS